MHQSKTLASSTVTFLALICSTGSYASALSDAADALQPGEWVVFDTQGYGLSLLDACDGIHSILEWSNKASWDPVRSQVHFVGQGHDGCAKHISYRESTNSWVEEPSPQSNILVGHGYEHNAIDTINGDFYTRLYNSDDLFRFNIASSNWTPLPQIGTGTQVAGAIAYHPGASGLIYVDGDYGIHFFSSQSNSWRLLANTTLQIDASKPTIDIGDYHNFASYNSFDNVIYFGGGNGSNNVFTLDSQLTIRQVADSPRVIAEKSALTMMDPASGDQLIFGDDGSMYSYDSNTDSWSSAGSHPVMDYARDWRVGVPITNHGVIMFFTWDFNNSKVLLYRHAQGGGTPPSTARPTAPSNLVAN